MTASLLGGGQGIRAAEEDAIEENRRKAQALVATNDCLGASRLQAQVSATSTAAVSSAVTAVTVKCTDKGSSQTAGQSKDQTHATTVDDHTPRGSKNPCDAMDVDDVMTQAQNQYIAGFVKSALQVVTKALACKQDVRTYRLAATCACAAHDATAAKQFFSKIAACVAHDGRAQAYYEKLPAHARPAVKQRCRQANVALVTPAPGAGGAAAASPRPGQPRCDVLDIDDMLGVASNQYEAGFPKAALALVNRVLACKQDARIYRMAAQYACAAHDVASARLYLPRVQQYFQASIIQRCQQEGLVLSGP